jgi:hypothetical protein
MGTNFYTKLKECEHCERYEKIHLGKSSGGWQFSFQYNNGEYYKNVEEMKEWLKDKKIINEYGDEESYDDFWEMVDIKQRDYTKNHAQDYPGQNEMVIDGYSFTNCEFS